MDISGWLNQTISCAAFTAGGTYGDGSYGSPVAEQARVQPKQQYIRSANGEEIWSTHEIWKLNAIGMEDRVWLPGLSTGDATLARIPLSIETLTDKDGNVSHYKVML